MPDNWRVFVFGGEIRDGKFRQDLFSPAAFYGASEDGYILGKATSGERLGITRLNRVSSPNDILPAAYVPCNGAEVMVFDTPAGKTIYVGDISIVSAGTGYRTSFRTDFTRARTWLNTHYPQLMAEVEEGKFEALPIYEGRC